MIYGLDDLRGGFETTADAIVVGSGAGGAVAAMNLAQAGLQVAVVEAGPRITPADMVRDAPRFMARYFWDGGLRVIGGDAQIPCMQGRCLGGSTVMNSAIMLKLPDWVRDLWRRDNDLDFLQDDAIDEGFTRAFEMTRTTPTPEDVLARRNILARDALRHAGLDGIPLPRAVHDCQGSGDCITGCFLGKKQSLDRAYLPHAEAADARIYTCSEVGRVLTRGRRAVGVSGRVIDPRGWKTVGRFTVRAPIVVLAAGAVQTPALLQQSRINPNRAVGSSLRIHLTGGVVAVMPEQVDPWIGATQGWGAFSKDVRGLKYECLWASPSVLTVRWGGLGRDFLLKMREISRATLIACVYRGECNGTVRAMPLGPPRMSLRFPKREVHTIMRAVKIASDALLEIGAEYVHTGIPGLPDEMRTPADTAMLLSDWLSQKHVSMTGNHIFGTCPMHGHPRRGVADERGRVKGWEGLYLSDASLFPSGSAVNPQATVMALADVVSRGIIRS